MNDKVIVLVGFMGCGKTAVAKELSGLLKKRCVDLDARIQDREGRSPAQIIKDDGEPAFRATETKTLRALLDSEDAEVIALGGGAWPIAVNRELVGSVDSIAIWLDTPFDICWQRIEWDSASRPMAPSRTDAEKLFSERIPFYRLADVQMAIANESPTQIAENIAALLQQQSDT
jgi:shikimate kinase